MDLRSYKILYNLQVQRNKETLIKQKLQTMQTYRITPGTILVYTCEYTGEKVTEIYSNYTGGDDYQMVSCAVYHADEIATMEVVSGEVVDLQAEKIAAEKELLGADYDTVKRCQRIVNGHGPTLMSADADTRGEYWNALETLKQLGYQMDAGKITTVTS